MGVDGPAARVALIARPFWSVRFLGTFVVAKRDKFKREKMRKKIAKYPGPTRQLLNKILEPRVAKPDDPDSDDTPTPTHTIGRSPETSHTTQLILSTATFRSHLTRFFFQGSG